MPTISNKNASTPVETDTFSADERTLYDHPTSDDERYDNGRPSGELSEGDHDILESEDERERLLTVKQEGIPGLFNKTKGIKIGRPEKKKASNAKRKERRRGQTEESTLMYEMEEGVGASSASMSRNSSESDQQRLLATKLNRKVRRSRIWRRIAIYLSIAILFLVLLFGAYQLSKSARTIPTTMMVSNGTSLFAPTTILISLDGFRADFLLRGLTPTLNRFIQEGISPKYMLPSFPSVTFPNHYTLATGLYPESHGVVGNTFWDPSLQKAFYYTDPEKSLQPHWWGGEPLWVTAERQKVRAAIHMWPGSEAHIGDIQPAYVDKFNGSELLDRKVDRILALLDIPGPLDTTVKADHPRPQLIAAYVPDVDSDGHKYGPNSTEIRQTIRNADTMLGSLLEGLQERNLTGIVNVVVVSDHGMASTDVNRLIQLEDLIDPNELEHIDGWPLYGLRPKKPEDLDRLHKELVEKAKTNPNIEVYLRDVDMPERYHFSKNERIAPLWIVPKTGWAIADKSEFDVAEGKKKGEIYHPQGIHGYDHEHPLMRAIFVARGPAFPHKPNSRMEHFQNIELYNIICDSIGVEPAPNNGTLRLPLKPVGLHSDSPPDETPVDPVESSSYLGAITMTSFSDLMVSASGLEDALSSVQFSSIQQITPATTPTSSAPPAASTTTNESWWNWFTHKADDIENWVDDFLHKNVPNATEAVE
ncbi:Phosphodiest-domain-containing protein [Pleomassaria siparia CBS 279.74]|uniref:Phosphodiest-domain-containing protein n=1 Tax=Pleomassaria siparia CBS 279.74 TaxID=1314801 RepID=A0A6G1K530_9PLEO|nr:Phosphodiest-domain-containing protein [Pleomassaria siparia CBS 279.74]